MADVQFYAVFFPCFLKDFNVAPLDTGWDFLLVKYEQILLLA